MRLLDRYKSDNLIFMKKTMTATEVARNFSEVLDLVEAGDEVEITRGKRVIAVLHPKAQSKTVGNLRKTMEQHRKQFGPMDDELLEIYRAVLDERYHPINMVGADHEGAKWER